MCVCVCVNARVEHNTESHTRTFICAHIRTKIYACIDSRAICALVHTLMQCFKAMNSFSRTCLYSACFQLLYASMNIVQDAYVAAHTGTYTPTFSPLDRDSAYCELCPGGKYLSSAGSTCLTCESGLSSISTVRANVHLVC